MAAYRAADVNFTSPRKSPSITQLSAQISSNHPYGNVRSGKTKLSVAVDEPRPLRSLTRCLCGFRVSTVPKLIRHRGVQRGRCRACGRLCKSYPAFTTTFDAFFEFLYGHAKYSKSVLSAWEISSQGFVAASFGRDTGELKRGTFWCNCVCLAMP